MLWFNETLYPHYGQRHEVDKVLFEIRSPYQHIIIFENKHMGRVLTLDGVVQTSERDEFVYHEMLTHVPILAHGNAKKVLIIGGGDGGIAREVLRHKSVEQATMVEIDGAVVEFCEKHLPTLSDGVFKNPRLNLVIDDGINFVKTCQDKFDIIISDSTDPIGVGEVLYTSEYFSNCKRCLNPGGIFVNQNGVAFHQLDEVVTSNMRTRPLFKDSWFYSAAVPGYIGGIMTFSWATDNPELRRNSVEEIAKRFKAANFKTRYYNPEVHVASFALPQYIQDAVESKAEELKLKKAG